VESDYEAAVVEEPLRGLTSAAAAPLVPLVGVVVVPPWFEQVFEKKCTEIRNRESGLRSSEIPRGVAVHIG
jgi:hypothetical protein